MSAIPLRTFGKTGWSVSEVGFGAWQLAGPNGSWAGSNDEDSIKALKAYLAKGGSLIDTANVYGDGHSEEIIGSVISTLPVDHHRVYVITKLGRCHGDVESPLSDSPHGPQNYTYEAMRASLEGSKKRLKVETIDLVQLHCPLMSVLKDPETWTALRKLRDTDKLISYFGVSIETCEEALYVLESVPDLASIQIIFNAFRFKPLEQVLPLAKQKQVAIIPRVPLASGLLSGKIDKSYLDSIAESDHRKFNSVGQVFDAGETWSGLGHTLDTAMTAVEEMKKLVPEGATLGQLALKWILMFPEVTTVIPGCRNEQQVIDNVGAASLPPLSKETMDAIEGIYEKYIKSHVHEKW